MKFKDFGYTGGLYPITLSDEQRRDLQRRTHVPGLVAATRDRLEMICLAAAAPGVAGAPSRPYRYSRVYAQ